MKTEITITQQMAKLTPYEARVAKFVLNNPEAIPFISLQGLAEKTETSDATVLRFCVALGFSGFQEFKTTFTSELIDRGLPQEYPQPSNDRYLTLLTRDLKRTLGTLPPNIIDIIADRIATCRYTVLTGLAGSGSVAEIVASGLLSLNIAAVRASDRVAIERWSTIVTKQDVFIGISHSGNAPEITAAIHHARERGAFTVAITNAERSNIDADHILMTSLSDQILGSNSCYPRVVQLTIFEFLLNAIALSKKRDTVT